MTSAFPVRFRTRRLMGLIAALVGLAGCAHPLPPAEYRAYLANPAHGLTYTHEVNGTTITCTYRPVELLVQQETKRINSPTLTQLDSVHRSYADKTYCTLTFSRKDAEIENAFIVNPAIYREVLAYLNGGIGAHVFLATTARDSVSASASTYVRGYGISKRSTLLLVFNTPGFQPQQGFHITLSSYKMMFDTQRFDFAAHDVASLPPLQQK